MKLAVKELEKVNYTIKEAALILSVGEHTLRALIDKGAIRCMLLPKLTIPYFEIERFMRKTIEEGTDYSQILQEGKE